MGESVTWTTVSNKYSEHDGKDVAKLSVNITNNNEDTGHLNTYYYSFFGSSGSELDSVKFYFNDDIGNAGDIRSGGSADTYFHLLYDGDGDYYIEFNNSSEKIEVKLPKNKNSPGSLAIRGIIIQGGSL